MIRVFAKGNTIRFDLEFKDWEGNVPSIDPTTVKFSILDSKFNSIYETTITEANKISAGKYYFYYTPTETGNFYDEWTVFMSGMPSVTRKVFTVKDFV